jgi:hypothetical protein
MTEQQTLDQLVQLVDELRDLFAGERRAIRSLDLERLRYLSEQRRIVTGRLTAVRDAAPASLAGDLWNLFTAIRSEAAATAKLATAACDALRGLGG